MPGVPTPIDPSGIQSLMNSLGNVTFLGVMLVAGLPTTAPVGTIAIVTNALTPAFNATVAGGGAVTVPVMWNGANWVCI